MYRTVVFDALEGTRDGCVLREQTHRRPILPGPAPPSRPALRRPTRTARGVSGFWVRQVTTSMWFPILCVIVLYCVLIACA